MKASELRPGQKVSFKFKMSEPSDQRREAWSMIHSWVHEQELFKRQGNRYDQCNGPETVCQFIADLIATAEASPQCEPTPQQTWWLWRSRDDGHWSVMKCEEHRVTDSFAFVNSISTAGYDEIYVEAIDAIRAVAIGKAMFWELKEAELQMAVQSITEPPPKALLASEAGKEVLPNLQLEAGKWYRQQSGKVVGPVSHYPAAGSKYKWHVETLGFLWNDQGNEFCETNADLIAEVAPPAPPQQPVTLTLGEARERALKQQSDCEAERVKTAEDAADLASVAASKAEGVYYSQQQVDAELDKPVSDDGWIEHDGKGCPVDAKYVIDVKLADGSTDRVWANSCFTWNNEERLFDGEQIITHYRPVKPTPSAVVTEPPDVLAIIDEITEERQKIWQKYSGSLEFADMQHAAMALGSIMAMRMLKERLQ